MALWSIFFDSGRSRLVPHLPCASSCLASCAAWWWDPMKPVDRRFSSSRGLWFEWKSDFKGVSPVFANILLKNVKNISKMMKQGFIIFYTEISWNFSHPYPSKHPSPHPPAHPGSHRGFQQLDEPWQDSATHSELTNGKFHQLFSQSSPFRHPRNASAWCSSANCMAVRPDFPWRVTQSSPGGQHWMPPKGFKAWYKQRNPGPSIP